MKSKPIVYERTAYEILGISSMATDDEVKRAFRNQSEKFNPGYYPKYKGNEIYCSKMESVFKLINQAFNDLGGWETIKEDRQRYNMMLHDENVARDQLNMPELKEVGLTKIIRWFTFTGEYSVDGIEGNIKPEDFEGVKRSILDGIIIGTGAGFEGFQHDYENKPPVSYSGPKSSGVKHLIDEFIRNITSPRRARERQRNKEFEHQMKIAREEEKIRLEARSKPREYIKDSVIGIDNYQSQKKREEGQVVRKVGIEDQRQVEDWKKGVDGNTRSEVGIVSPINKITPTKERGFESGIAREYSSGAEGRKG